MAIDYHLRKRWIHRDYTINRWDSIQRIPYAIDWYSVYLSQPIKNGLKKSRTQNTIKHSTISISSMLEIQDNQFYRKIVDSSRFYALWMVFVCLCVGCFYLGIFVEQFWRHNRYHTHRGDISNQLRIIHACMHVYPIILSYTVLRLYARQKKNFVLCSERMCVLFFVFFFRLLVPLAVFDKLYPTHRIIVIRYVQLMTLEL